MILSETSLSFLGLGLRSPAISWGMLLQIAECAGAGATAPWLFIPGDASRRALLALNFLGDGLRRSRSVRWIRGCAKDGAELIHYLP